MRNQIIFIVFIVIAIGVLMERIGFDESYAGITVGVMFFSIGVGGSPYVNSNLTKTVKGAMIFTLCGCLLALYLTTMFFVVSKAPFDYSFFLHFSLLFLFSSVSFVFSRWFWIRELREQSQKVSEPKT